MKVDSSCVHIVMDHYLSGIYVLSTNQLALIIHIVKKIQLLFISIDPSFFFCHVGRIAKDDTRQFGSINKVVWTAMKSSYVFISMRS